MEGCGGKDRTYRIWIAVLALLSLALLIAVIVLGVRRCEQFSVRRRELCPTGPACPDGWVGYRGKCYYFSEVEGNWTYSQNNCSALNASLAGINTQQELDFMMRYKGDFHYWIGLRRDPGQPWKWANGSVFNNWFTIGGESGDCACLGDQGSVRSLECTGLRCWLCTKPDVFTAARRTSPLSWSSTEHCCSVDVGKMFHD